MKVDSLCAACESILDLASASLSPSYYDGVHFTEQGHKAFATGLLEELK